MLDSSSTEHATADLVSRDIPLVGLGGASVGRGYRSRGHGVHEQMSKMTWSWSLLVCSDQAHQCCQHRTTFARHHTWQARRQPHLHKSRRVYEVFRPTPLPGAQQPALCAGGTSAPPRTPPWPSSSSERASKSLGGRPGPPAAAKLTATMGRMHRDAQQPTTRGFQP